MTDILNQIVERKKHELGTAKISRPLSLIKEIIAEMPPARDFRNAISSGPVQIIAEVKKASPSRGLLCPDFDPVKLATAYEANGASAISVLTETHYFLGRLQYLAHIKAKVNIPLLRKDFILEPYQVYESRVSGADAILLIAAILEAGQLSELIELGRLMGMACLVEIHNKSESDKALSCGADIIGINNRDLKTFITDINVTRELRNLIPENITVVSESGINGKQEMDILKQYGVNAVLIGEALVTAKDPGIKLKEMRQLLK